MRNAYLTPRKIIEGCDHNRLWCKCDAPYWLRPPTEDETRMSGRLWAPLPAPALVSPA